MDDAEQAERIAEIRQTEMDVLNAHRGGILLAHSVEFQNPKTKEWEKLDLDMPAVLRAGEDMSDIEVDLDEGKGCLSATLRVHPLTPHPAWPGDVGMRVRGETVSIPDWKSLTPKSFVQAPEGIERRYFNAPECNPVVIGPAPVIIQPFSELSDEPFLDVTDLVATSALYDILKMSTSSTLRRAISLDSLHGLLLGQSDAICAAMGPSSMGEITLRQINEAFSIVAELPAALRIMARVEPQEGYAQPYEVDVTEAVLRLTLDEIKQLEDRTYSTDVLVPPKGNQPLDVVVSENVLRYFGVESSADITQPLLDKLVLMHNLPDVRDNRRERLQQKLVAEAMLQARLASPIIQSFRGEKANGYREMISERIQGALSRLGERTWAVIDTVPGLSDDFLDAADIMARSVAQGVVADVHLKAEAERLYKPAIRRSPAP